MKELQQSVFLNFSRVTRYQQRSKYLSQPRAHFAKCMPIIMTVREQEIRNEFELVDFEGKGRLFRQQIKKHLNEKYQQVNIPLLDNILSKMRWDEDDSVQKEQFCNAYLKRQKQIYHLISSSTSYSQRLSTLKDIFIQTKPFKPKLYAKVRILKLYIKSDREGRENEQWMNLQIDYQDHKNKFNYLIEEPSYGTEEPSFEVILPVQQKYFFLKYRFLSPKHAESIYGQCYLNIPLASDISAIKRSQKVTVDVINNNNEKKGFCEFSIQFQNEHSIEAFLENMERQQPLVTSKTEILNKQYEYMQYLWGIRHKYPHKINKIDVKWIVALRIIAIVILAILSICVQVLGRCQPLSFILALVLAKNWKYVMLRNQKFLLSWVAIGAVVLDLIWISFGGDQLSQINYLNLTSCIILTYFLIAAKVLLLVYLIIVEKSFSEEEDDLG